MALSSAYIVFATFMLLAAIRYSPINKVKNRIHSEPHKISLSGVKVRQISAVLLFVSTIFTVMYGLNGGFGKLSLLGSDFASRDFRFLNFNEVPREYTYLLQIVRRIILPVLIFSLVFLNRLGLEKLNLLIIYAISLQILASALTFARAPFAMLVTSLLLAFYLSEKSARKRTCYIALGSILFVIVGGLITQLQYNIIEFSIMQVISTGIDFMLNRAWLVPAAVPINLSFAVYDGYSDSLLLSGSRFVGMLTGNVIGTLQDNSILVAPVGFIGDIWRNFGFIGILLSPIAFTAFFGWLDSRHERISLLRRYVGSYLVIALVFYWIMGVIFSAGAILTVIVVTLVYIPKLRISWKVQNTLQ